MKKPAIILFALLSAAVAASAVASPLDALIYGVRRVYYGGAQVAERNALEFLGPGVSVADNATTKRTEITITGGGGEGGGGDFTGPASSTANALVRFNGTSGKIGKNSGATLDDSGNLTITGTLNGRTLATDAAKLDGIATGATANSSDATLLARANHTGTQAQSTVTNLVTDLAAKAAGAASSTDNAITRFDGTTGKVLQNSAVTIDDSGNIVTAGKVTGANGTNTQDYVTKGQLDSALISAGSGDVVGPGSSTDNAVARYDLATGKLIQNSLVTISDVGSITLAASQTVDGRDVSVDGTKLDGIATGATANSSDATLLARANHTGTQAISTVTSLQSSLDAKAAGAASSTDNAVTRFDGLTGKILQNSAVTIDDTGNISTVGTVDGRDVGTDGATLTSHVANVSNPHSVTAAQTGAPPTSRTISTTAPLTGGGDLSANRTLAITAASGAAAGSMSAADFTKLAGIATGATVNSADATLLARANHTGSQAISTVTSLQTSLDAKAAGAASSTDNAIARFDGTTGKIIQNSAVTIDDTTGNITTSGTFDGRDVSADAATLTSHVANVSNPHSTTAAQLGAVPTSRTISTTAPITGGGDLSSNRTLAIPAATGSVDGYATATQITKLNGIATGATANSTDAQLRDRTTHTGSQAISTVTSLQAALDAKVAGPASAADAEIARFDTTTGKAIKGSGVTIDNFAQMTGVATYYGSHLILTGNITVPGSVDGRDVSADGAKIDAMQTAVSVVTATGSWAKPAGIRGARFIVIGGGGGGAGGSDGTAGGGGGSGWVHTVDIPAAYIPASVSVVIGAGGSAGSAPVGYGTAGGLSSVTLTSGLFVSANGGLGGGKPPSGEEYFGGNGYSGGGGGGFTTGDSGNGGSFGSDGLGAYSGDTLNTGGALQVSAGMSGGAHGNEALGQCGGGGGGGGHFTSAVTGSNGSPGINGTSRANGGSGGIGYGAGGGGGGRGGAGGTGGAGGAGRAGAVIIIAY